MHDDSSPEGGDVSGNANALAKGTRLFEFEIERVLGEGGFAIVYLAFDHSLHRHVALKEYLPAEFAFRQDENTILLRSVQHQKTFEAGRKSFVQEARFLAQFEHPSLVKVHRVFESNGTAYMVQGYYAGESLGAVLKAGRRYASEAELRPIVAALLGAVDLLHARQCLHRDIAPDNIIIQPSGVPVLLDFGAARRIIGDMTQALTAVLKPSFAPIEQYTEDGGLAQGPWTDVYALAATLRMAIVGKPPPSSVGRTIKDALVKFADDPPPNFGLTFLRGIDAGLALLPADRPQTIAEFRSAMGLPIDDEVTTPPEQRPPVVAPPVSPSPPAPAPASRVAPTPAPTPDPKVTTATMAATATAATATAFAVPRAHPAVPPPIRAAEASPPPQTKSAPPRSLKRGDAMLILIAAAALGLLIVVPFAADWIWPSPASTPVRRAVPQERAPASSPASKPATPSPAPATAAPGAVQPTLAAATPPAPALAPAAPTAPAPPPPASKDGKAGPLPEKAVASAPVAPSPVVPPPAVSAAAMPPPSSVPKPAAAYDPAAPPKQEPPPKPLVREVSPAPAPSYPATSPIPTPAQPVASPAPPREEPPPRLAAVAPPQAAPPAPLDSAKARRTLLRVSGDPPVYPREAIRSGIESGRVVALVTVDAQGNVADVDIVRSEPPLVFDRAARAALAAWKFKAEGDRYRGEVELRFNLKE